jgi:hypothetical protein
VKEGWEKEREGEEGEGDRESEYPSAYAPLRGHTSLLGLTSVEKLREEERGK